MNADLFLVIGFFFVFSMLFIVVPYVTGYYLHKRLWMSDRLRLFLSISLFSSATFVIALLIIKVMS